MKKRKNNEIKKIHFKMILIKFKINYFDKFN